MSEDLKGPPLDKPVGEGSEAPASMPDTAAPIPTPATPDEAEMVNRALGGQRRYTGRFALAYAGLGVIFALAVTGLIVLVIKPGYHSPGAWSTWKPASGTTAKMASEIADHVSQEYHLNKAGSQLVAVVSGPPQVTSGTHKVAISALAVRKKAQSNAGIQVLSSSKTWTDQFCGLGASCSIASGKASQTRGRLVRREALEVALYTFKFAPAIDSVVAFMPPPPGQTTTTLLLLQKADLKQELSQPLRKTLPLARPPLPSSADTSEATTIDKLTLPGVFSYSLTQLQDGSAALVLDPVAS